MQNIDDKILAKVSKCGRGTIFFPNDFISIGETKSVLKALERMTNDGIIIRLAKGIYCYPKIDKVLGLGILYPSFEDIAQSIAKRDKARIVPTGLYAMNKLGLSTQIPMNIVYMTDGSPRKINMGNGRSIQFKHAAPKNLSFRNELAMLVTFALKEIKQKNVTDKHLERIKEILKKETKEKVLIDAKLMPSWIRTIIRKAYE
ncbi:MAG: hypothetical protein H6Q16_924 [Bacteroidetes bacterium]|nr:hypothetical protein [Bacteroidota bacterium]